MKIALFFITVMEKHFLNSSLSIFIFLIIQFILNFFNRKAKFYFDLDSKFSSSITDDIILNDICFFLIFVGILIPIFEEICFRLWPGKQKKIQLISIFSLFIYLMLLYKSFIFILIIMIIFSFHVFHWEKIGSNNILKVLLIILNSALFAVIHLITYEKGELIANYLFIPFLLFPQFILGILTFILRLQFGFITSTFFHCLYNIMIIVYSYLELLR
jgi:hypothetical protein